MNTSTIEIEGRLAAIGVGLVLLAGMTALLFQGFAGVASAQTPTSTPLISNITASTSAATTTIRWLTDQPANSQVRYGTTTSYTASSTLDSALVTDHSMTLTGLSPNTLYHFSVFSANASGTQATSSDMIFTTASSTTSTAPTSTAPAISSIAATTTATGAVITWLTDQPSDTHVRYGQTTAYNASSTLGTALVTNHTAFLGGLSPNTLYHFAVFSKNATGTQATSSDMTFVTLASPATSTATSTATTTDEMIDELWDAIRSLQNRVQWLEQQVNWLLLQQGGNGGTGTSTPPANPTLTPQTIIVSPGAIIDWNGRNFRSEEDVNVILNGQSVRTAHADRGGNFTTGSYTLPTAPGTYVYTFQGAKGTVMTSTVTVR